MIEEISGDLFQWLRGFCFLAETGSARQAALAMGRQQPTITRQIKCLEKELGVSLFDRSARGMRMTPEGELLLSRAISIFEDVKAIKNDLRRLEGTYEGDIIVAATQATIDYFLPRYVAEFRKTHPLVIFHFEGGTRETVLQRIESAEADVGFGYFDAASRTIDYVHLFDAGLVLIAPKNNSFFSSRSPTLEEIARAPLVLFSHRGWLERLINTRFAEEGVKPNVVMTHNNHMSVQRYVALGMGVGILGEHAVPKEDENMIDTFPLDRYFPRRKYGLLLRKRKYHSPMLKAFIRTIKPDVKFP